MKGSFIKALPIVAKALSENYGVSLAIYGNQAKTDGKHIVLPVLPEDDYKATVLARGYLDHEAAHVKFTDFDNWERIGFEGNVLNILEDVRIEQAMGRRYRGCRDNLDDLTRLLVAEGDFKSLKPGDPPANVVQSYLRYTLRSRILGQQALEPLASQAEAIFDATFPGLRLKVEPIALEVKDAPDTQAVKDITRRIMDLLNDEAQQSPAHAPSDGQDKQEGESDNDASAPESDEQQNDDQEESSDGSGAGEESPDPSQPDGYQDSEADGQGESDESQSTGSNQADEQDSQEEGQPGNREDGDNQPGNGQKSQPGDQAGEAQDDNNGTEDGTDSSHSQSNPQGAQDGDSQSEPSSSCQDSKSAGSTAAAEALADGTSYHDLGQIVAEKLGDMSSPESGQEMAVEIPAWWTDKPPMKENELMQATARLRAMLAGVVQSKRSKRSRLSLSGTKLDLRNLHRLAVNDGRVFLSREERTGVNTAVYLLMDQSSSMSYTAIKTAFMATAALARALRSIPGTAVAAGSFSSKYFKGEPDDRAYVASLLKFDESERQMSLVIPPSELYTPMAEAMYCVAAKLLLRPEPRRLLIVMTDGEPDDFKATQEIIGKCRIAGMEVYAVGIMESSVKPLFGKEFAIVVNTIGELPDRLFRLLANRL